MLSAQTLVYQVYSERSVLHDTAPRSARQKTASLVILFIHIISYRICCPRFSFYSNALILSLSIHFFITLGGYCARLLHKWLDYKSETSPSMRTGYKKKINELKTIMAIITQRRINSLYSIAMHIAIHRKSITMLEEQRMLLLHAPDI